MILSRHEVWRLSLLSNGEVVGRWLVFQGRKLVPCSKIRTHSLFEGLAKVAPRDLTPYLTCPFHTIMSDGDHRARTGFCC